MLSEKIRMAFPGLCTLLLALLLGVIWPVTPITAHFPIPGASNAQESDQAQSVSGTVAYVGKSSFTLTVGSAAYGPGHQLQESSPRSMTFMIDKNTTVEGKLKVGANADVTYREDNGNHIAISVHVAS
ncbi:MAG: hypothetical protein WBQ89_24725 [Candidatus Acidiferrum sp.]